MDINEGKVILSIIFDSDLQIDVEVIIIEDPIIFCNYADINSSLALIQDVD